MGRSGKVVVRSIETSEILRTEPAYKPEVVKAGKAASVDEGLMHDCDWAFIHGNKGRRNAPRQGRPTVGLRRRRRRRKVTRHERETTPMATSIIDIRTDIIKDEIADLEERLAARKADLAAAVPAEPERFNTVIRFIKWGSQYSYAAIKVGSQWYVTQDGSRSSRQGIPPRAWGELLAWIGERNWDSIEVLS